MGYQLQVVPLREFERHRQRLQVLPVPFDRGSALPVAACALLLRDSAEHCLTGLAEEKRLLAIWVRQGRMGVRLIRGKGSSNERAWANASLSNAADQVRNRLDRLALEAPRGRDQALQRLRETARFVGQDEARSFIPAYLDGVCAAERAQTTRGLCVLLYVAGGLLVFVAWPLALALLALAGLLQLGFSSSWQAVAQAESQRLRQRGEVQAEAAEAHNFLERLEQAPSARDPQLDAATITAIAADLRRQHVFLEVACRELGSHALSWEQLAMEIMPAQQLAGEDGTGAHGAGRGSGTPPSAGTLGGACDPVAGPSGRQAGQTEPASTTAAVAAAASPEKGGQVGTDGWVAGMPPAHPSNTAAPIPPLPPSSAHARLAEAPGLENATALGIPVRLEADAVVFGLELAGAQAILRRLGYRRLPRSWPSLSARAQQRLSVYLAALVSLRVEAYRWSFEEGAVRATSWPDSADP